MPMAADKSFAIEATFHFQHVTDELIPQLFVTDSSDLLPDRATTPHELVWLVRQGSAHIILPDGRIDDSTQKISDGQTVTVRMLIGPNSAQIVSDGKTQWAGLNQLNGNPRFVGVRFLHKGGDNHDAVTLQSIKIMTK